MLQRLKLVIPTLVLLGLALGAEPPRLLHSTAPGTGASARARQRALVNALVLPRLSFECILALGEAVRTCSSPGAGGAVACGMALVHILRVCP